MRTSFKAAIASVAILLGSAASASADLYKGPGFSGSLWVAQGGGQVQEMGTVHAGQGGFLLNMEIQGQSISTLMKWDSDLV